jgi:hypothetical protein
LENANLILKKDQISKLLLQIQNNYNNSLQYKLSSKIEDLINFERSLKINYIIIKKLDLEKLVEVDVDSADDNK